MKIVFNNFIFLRNLFNLLGYQILNDLLTIIMGSLNNVVVMKIENR